MYEFQDQMHLNIIVEEYRVISYGDQFDLKHDYKLKNQEFVLFQHFDLCKKEYLDHEGIEQKNLEQYQVHRFRDYVYQIIHDLVNE